ncbi:2-succinyl-6-hydroxy-2,4-cyclohexadiene-1-carboxylate synthase [Shewanella xiamenensis]|uniref:2-succinyl-6-hydroxy-2, 4-cyclohexadiene-1-carboxylate synthase n=1 Tax=Shewanella xiamenensis TaxID=332186 RepID=UPI00313EB6B9
MPTVARYGETAQPNLVLIHGFLGSKADWLPLIPKLSQHFHCICLDLPGHGDNQPEIASTLTDGFDFCVQDIISRLDRLGIEAFYLYGYSLGGRIALHLAQAYPQRVLSLWLESCHPGLTNTEEQAARSKSDNLWAKRLQSLSSVDFLQLWYQQAVFANMPDKARNALIAKRVAQLDQHSKHTLKQIFLATSLARQASLWDLPASLACKCHFFAGSQDAKFTAIAKDWQAQQPIVLHQIDDAGHNIHQANPTGLLACIRSLFVERLT